MSDKQTCCARVYNKSGTFGNCYKPCVRTGKVERDGKWYCGIHDPERQAEIRALTVARWKKEAEEQRRVNRLHAAAQDLLSYAECEEARACSEDVAETVLRRYGYKPGESSQDFMDKMRRAALAKARGES